MSGSVHRTLVVLGSNELAPHIARIMPGYQRYIVLLDASSPMVTAHGRTSVEHAVKDAFGPERSSRPEMAEIEFDDGIVVRYGDAWRRCPIPNGDLMVIGVDWVPECFHQVVRSRRVFSSCQIPIPRARRVHASCSSEQRCACSVRTIVCEDETVDHELNPHADADLAEISSQSDANLLARECIVCGTSLHHPESASVGCVRCSAATCSHCTAMMSIASTDASLWRCPQCRTSVRAELLGLVSRMPRTRSFASPRAAISWAVGTLGDRQINVGYQTVSSLGISTHWIEMERCQTKGYTPIVFDDVEPQNAHMILVGAPPRRCRRCRCVHNNDLERGMAFVLEGGSVREMPGSFGILTARSRAGHQHGAIDRSGCAPYASGARARGVAADGSDSDRDVDGIPQDEIGDDILFGLNAVDSGHDTSDVTTEDESEYDGAIMFSGGRDDATGVQTRAAFAAALAGALARRADRGSLGGVQMRFRLRTRAEETPSRGNGDEDADEYENENENDDQ